MFKLHFEFSKPKYAERAHDEFEKIFANLKKSASGMVILEPVVERHRKTNRNHLIKDPSGWCFDIIFKEVNLEPGCREALIAWTSLAHTSSMIRPMPSKHGNNLPLI